MAVSLSETSERLLTCVCDALAAAGRPACSCHAVVGTPVVFNCCECEEDATGDLTIHFLRMFDADSTSLLEVQRVRPCKGGVVAAQFRLILSRCHPTVNERGEPPHPDELVEAAQNQMRDAELIWQSLACCTGLDLRIDDITADPLPQAGCSVIFADVTAQVKIPALPDSSL